MRALFSKYRAGAVFISLLCIEAGMLGILANCTGILFSAVIAEFGFRAGDLSLYYLIRSLTAAASCGILTRLFFERNAKAVITAVGAVSAVAFGLMGSFNSLWQWYLSALFSGIGISFILVMLPIVINNWFAKNNGLLIGLAMSASGIAGAGYGQVCSVLISRYGWRTATVLTAASGFLVAVIPALLFLRAAPKLDPAAVRAQEAAARAQLQAGQAGQQVARWVFPLCAGALIGVASFAGLSNQMPIYAQSLHYSLEVGATLASLTMLGNVVGKLSIGVLADRIGAYRATKLLVMLVGCALLLLVFATGLLPVLYVAALLFGTIYAMGTTVPALLLLDLYGKEHYKPKVSRYQSLSAVIAACAGALLPYLYDFTGSFALVFALGAAVCALALPTLGVLHRYSDRRRAKHLQQEAA